MFFSKLKALRARAIKRRASFAIISTAILFLLTGNLFALSPAPGKAASLPAETGATTSYQLLAANSLSTGHTAPVEGAFWSPDGTRLATVSTDTLLRLWKVDTQNGSQPRLECTLYNYPHPLVSVAWSPDGSQLATGDVDGGLKLWNSDCTAPTTQAPTLPETLGEPLVRGSVRSVAFSPDGKWLASGGADNQVRVWPLDPGLSNPPPAFTFDNGPSGINSVRWSSNGQFLAFVTTNSRLGIVTFNPVQPASSTFRIYSPGVNQPLRSLAWLRDQPALVVGTDNGQVILFNLNILSGDFEKTVSLTVGSADTSVLGLNFSPQNENMAVAAGNVISIWSYSPANAQVFSLKQTLTGHTGTIRSIQYSPDGRWLVSASDDHNVFVWDGKAKQPQPVSGLGASLNYQTSVHWGSDGQNLITSGDDGLTRLWRPSDAGLKLVLNTGVVTAISTPTGTATGRSASPGRVSIISPDGKWVAAATDDGTIQLWSAANLASPARWAFRSPADGAIYTLAFSPDSRTLYSGGQAGKVATFQLTAGDANWQVGNSIEIGRSLHSLAVSPKGDLLVTGSDDGTLRWWKTSNLAPNLPPLNIRTAHQGNIKDLEFNSDGTRLISAGGDGRVLVWDVATGTIIKGVQLGSPVKALALARDGQIIAAALSDGSITVYDSLNNQPYLTIQGHGLAALGLDFSPDLERVGSVRNTRLAVVTLDGALQVWQLNLNPSATGGNLTEASPAQSPDPASSFVMAGAASDHLTLNGQNILLKGVNFYPRLASWAAMWQHWNGPQVSKDLDAAASLGINSLRILIPYGSSYEWTGPDGTPDPEMLGELDQLVAMASQHHFRLLLTLFDFYGDFPAAGTQAETANYNYLAGLVTRYRDNPVILGWDIHNEPDNYNLWQNGENFTVLDWLERMAQRIRQLDPNHWVTVGFGNTANLNQAGPDGISPLAIVDVAALHAYDPTTIGAQAGAARFGGQNHLPVFLEEYGWPAGPTELTDQYSEAVQASHYQAAISAIAASNLDGGIAWSLWDTNYDTINGLRPLSIQNFGLLRLDNTLRPAAFLFRSGSGSDLLTASTTTPTLTVRTVDPNKYGQYFEQTGYLVPAPFKEYWNLHRGLTVFGYPISPVMVQNGFLVQYFERARFEYHPEVTTSQGFASLDPALQLNKIVELGLLVDEKLTRENRHFDRAAPLSGPDRVFFDLTGHNLGGKFKEFWQNNGGLAQFGYPVSEEFTEVSPTDGKTYLVQYFERARFEYHPENAGTAYEVELGQLGREALVQTGLK